MKIESNLASVMQNIQIDLTSLKDADKLFRQAAFDSVALISDRVQQDGLKTNETPIKSFYSLAYGKKRRKEGLQTQYVDLTFDGDMMDDFTAAQSGNEYHAGFRSEKQGQKADWNEQRFGTIFNLSGKETKTVVGGILNKVDDTFR